MVTFTMSSKESGSISDPARKSVIDQACKVGEDFVKLYYRTLEQRPHRVYQLYLEASVVIWDGNPQVGVSNLQKFFEDLPSLTFNIGSMDSQPLSSMAVGQQKSFLINTSGSYRASHVGNRSFVQTFVVTEEGGKWKVASDVFRSQISPNQPVV